MILQENALYKAKIKDKTSVFENMKIITIRTTALETNTYLVLNGAEAFVVDPGDNAEGILSAAKEEGAEVKWVLLTHAHFDHTGAVAALQAAGALVVMHRDDVPLISSFRNLAFYAGCKVDKFVPDVVVSGAETLDVCGLDVRVIHTPGHTSGGVCYIVGDSIFSGDTLFELSYGRTDFPTGSFKELKNSVVNKLFALKGDYKVYPGHGAPTTLQFEREHNPILTD